MKKLKIFLFLIAFIAILGRVSVINAAELGDNGKMIWKTNLNNATYNIKGYVNGNVYQTTYGDQGYQTILKYDDITTRVVCNAKNGTETFTKYMNPEYYEKLEYYEELYYAAESEEEKDAIEEELEAVLSQMEEYVDCPIGLTITPTFVNKGSYVKVEYKVKNNGNESKIISIGTFADSEIGDNDSAPLEVIDDSLIVMSDGETAQFNLVTKEAYGVTDVDTIWVGYWGEAGDNAFINYDDSDEVHYNDKITYNDEGKAIGIDSGLSFSWKDIELAEGETKTFSVLFGVGPVNKAPKTEITEFYKNDTLGDNVFTVKGKITDEEKTSNTEVYYSVEGKEGVVLYTFTGEPGAFEANITLSDEEAKIAKENGESKIEIFAQDEDGAVSNAVKKYAKYAVLRKLEDEGTKIKLEGTFTGNVKLIIEKIESKDNYNEKLTAKISDKNAIIDYFNVSLVDNCGTEISEYKGKIKITFPVDEKYNGQTIIIEHYIKAKDEVEEFEVKVENGEVTVEVDNLSPFMLLSKPEKDETPQTGNNNFNIIMTVLLAISVLEIIVLKK